jgi:hypothetical protein
VRSAICRRAPKSICCEYLWDDVIVCNPQQSVFGTLFFDESVRYFQAEVQPMSREIGLGEFQCGPVRSYKRPIAG